MGMVENKIAVVAMTDQARAEMVYDARTAIAISHAAGDGHVERDQLTAAIFTNIQLERRLAAHNPARKVFNSDPS